MPDPSKADLVEEVEALKAQLAELSTKDRPGRKAKKIVVMERGVCGVDPTRDSATCPDASLYRRQLGCLGTACVGLSSKYYQDYRRKERSRLAEEDDE